MTTEESGIFFYLPHVISCRLNFAALRVEPGRGNLGIGWTEM